MDEHIFALVPEDRVKPRKAGGYIVDLGTADDLLRLVLAAEANPGQGVQIMKKEEGPEAP